ncbi:hypothetical protein H0H81_006019 [Sphagnurus paluster]|uniref:non-specific serine/threonine protein kinase n=1 Tax=Sphagnurus paluster TaxID=117069 RepID=A0A9P7GKU6_9AGAR|nr:hypothetical protein H0H81_006019 [Sphagnurus paluster]
MFNILQRTLKRLPTRSSMSTLRNIKFFQDQQVSVTDTTGREDDFVCKDEPHFLGAEHGLGYNPLLPGALYPGPSGHEKVQILRKLGVGSTASVWMAAFTGETRNMKQKFGALKVLTASVTNRILQDEDQLLPADRELMSIERITDANPNHPGHKHCVHLLGKFISNSCHGPHITLVTDVFGSDLESLQYSQPTRTFSVSVTKRIIKQTLLALDYIHTECGLVHCGK